MNLRGITASFAVIAVAVVLPIAIATPAQAAADPSVVSYGELPPPAPRGCTALTNTARANPGDRISLHNDCTYGTIFYVIQGTTLFDQWRVPAGGQVTFAVPTATGTYNIQGLSTIGKITLVVTDVPIPPAKAHDEFQQVGVPASGDCGDVDPATGHYPGYPIGGWSQSWAQWINDGTGGPICTREVEQRPDGTIVLIG
jgi:hypothetical protein